MFPIGDRSCDIVTCPGLSVTLQRQLRLKQAKTDLRTYTDCSRILHITHILHKSGHTFTHNRIFTVT